MKKIDKLNFMKIKNFCASKNAIKMFLSIYDE